jgi:PAS domain S-box-containing protein
MALPPMIEMLSIPANESGLVTGLAALLFCAVVYGGLATLGWMRARKQNRQYATALDHMTQGLCLVDAKTRIILCNQRYITMYGMSPKVVKPGTSMRDMLKHRASVGQFSGDIDQYMAAIQDRIDKRQGQKLMLALADGRHIALAEQPLADGSWVATHDDVTELYNVERQRADMKAKEDRRAAIDEAIGSFRQRVENVLRAVGDNAAAIKMTAGTLLASSEQTSRQAEGAVQATDKASRNPVTAAAAADELATSIADMSKQLGQTTGALRLAASEAQSTNDQISALSESSQKIGDVVQLIRSIAGQTNLLALNATIEAARAGEAGRGFAVVASEVKSLAVQTAKATEEISAQIDSVQESTRTAVDAIHRISSRMLDIDRHASAVAASVEQQSSATSEISRSVSNAAQGTGNIVSVLNQLSGTAAETRKSAESVLQVSESVGAAVSNLRSEVENFLRKVAV